MIVHLGILSLNTKSQSRVLDLAVWVEEIEVAPMGWMFRSFMAAAAEMTSACRLESHELLSSLQTFGLTHPQHTGGLRQVILLIIHHQMPD